MLDYTVAHGIIVTNSNSFQKYSLSVNRLPSTNTSGARNRDDITFEAPHPELTIEFKKTMQIMITDNLCTV